MVTARVERASIGNKRYLYSSLSYSYISSIIGDTQANKRPIMALDLVATSMKKINFFLAHRPFRAFFGGSRRLR